MSMRRPAAGRQIASGVIRVDADRAIAKLREYQLSDPTAWILEAIRAGVASGATSMDLQGDSNDVWLSWQGPRWSGCPLPDLFDELVSPTSAQQGQQSRLLATAVNSALGLDLAYLDIFVQEEAMVGKVRYEPKLLNDVSGPENSRQLARLEMQEAQMPARAEGAAFFLHLRRRLGLEQLQNLFRGSPKELLIAAEACTELGLPISIGTQEYGAHLQSGDLLRVPLGQNIRGHLALLDVQKTGTQTEVQLVIAEQGVRIATHLSPLGPEGLRGPVPLRLFVDAERMPTNASRSDVRREMHPIKSAEQQIPDLVSALCSALKAELAGEYEEIQASVRLAAMRESVLLLVGTQVAGRDWYRRLGKLEQPYRLLTGLKLLRNALGDAVAVRSNWLGDVYTGDAPLPAEMKEWFAHTLWAPRGDASQAMTHDPAAQNRFEQRLRTARHSLKVRKRFMDHKPRAAVLKGANQKNWGVVALSLALPNSSAPPAAYKPDGELRLLRSGSTGTLTVLYKQRELDTVELLSTLPFEAIVSTQKIVPESDYRAVVRSGKQYWQMVHAVQSAAIRFVELLCAGGPVGVRGQAIPDAQELRSLVLAALTLSKELELNISLDSPLAQVQAWSLQGGGWASLQELSKMEVLSLVSDWDSGMAPSSRPAVVCPNVLLAELLELVLDRTLLVHYSEKHLVRGPQLADDLARKLASKTGAVSLAIQSNGLSGAVAWSAGCGIVFYHRGVRFSKQEGDRLSANVCVVIDSDQLIPTADWQRLHDGHQELEQADYGEWELALVRAYALSRCGKDVPGFHEANPGASISGSAGRCFSQVLQESDDLDALLGPNLHQALLQAPLFERLHGDRVSALQLAREGVAEVEYLEQRVGLQGLPRSWNPLYGRHWHVAVAARLCELPLREASGQVAERVARAKAGLRRTRHMEQARKSLESCISATHRIPLRDTSPWRGYVAIGVPASDPQAYAQLEVFVEGRHFASLTLPCDFSLLAVVELPVSGIDVSFTTVPREVLDQIGIELVAHAHALLLAALKRTPLEYTHALQFLFVRWLEQQPSDSALVREVLGLVHLKDQYGAPLPLEEAIGSGRLRFAMGTGLAWVAPAKGQSHTALDERILYFEDRVGEEMTDMLQAVAAARILLLEDLSGEIRQFQVERRIAQGLVQTPVVDARFKRRISQLSMSDALGEIGLCEGESATLHLWAHGQAVVTIKLSLSLPVVVALDHKETLLAHQRGSSNSWLVAQKEVETSIALWAHALLVEVLNSEAKLAKGQRKSLAKCLLNGRLCVEEVAGLARYPLFVTIDQRFVSWQELVQQRARFGDLWYARIGETRTTLDPERIVLALDSATPELAPELQLVQASNELALDALAIANRRAAQHRALSLSESQETHVVSVVEIGDLEGLCGVVAPLLPSHASDRAVWAQREEEGLGKAEDPCVWPTLAIVEDSELQPNRTWSAPLCDERWRAVAKSISKASDLALSKFIKIPRNALTSHWVGRSVESQDPQYTTKGVVFRGRLWLTASSAGASIRVDGSQGSEEIALRSGDGVLLPVHGHILCHAGQGAASEADVREVVDWLYPRLLRQLRSAKKASEDSRAAHFAIALAVQAVRTEAAEDLEFPFSSDISRSAEELLQLLESDSIEVPQGNGEFYQAMLRLRAGRRKDALALAQGKGAEVSSSDISETPRDVSQPLRVLPDLEADLLHRLQALELDPAVLVVEVGAGRSPLVAVEHKLVRLAGGHPVIKSLQAACIADTVNYSAALELVVAHCLTVLNSEFLQLTDAAEQRMLRALLRG